MPKRLRFRQMDRAVLQSKNPDLIGTVRLDDGFLHMILIPPGDVSKYKKYYGNKLDIWFEDEFMRKAEKGECLRK